MLLCLISNLSLLVLFLSSRHSRLCLSICESSPLFGVRPLRKKVKRRDPDLRLLNVRIDSWLGASRHLLQRKKYIISTTGIEVIAYFFCARRLRKSSHLCNHSYDRFSHSRSRRTYVLFSFFFDAFANLKERGTYESSIKKSMGHYLLRVKFMK